eukprot:4245459-Pleurochrysis_carterae.AAC.1
MTTYPPSFEKVSRTAGASSRAAMAHAATHGSDANATSVATPAGRRSACNADTTAARRCDVERPRSRRGSGVTPSVPAGSSSSAACARAFVSWRTWCNRPPTMSSSGNVPRIRRRC